MRRTSHRAVFPGGAAHRRLCTSTALRLARVRLEAAAAKQGWLSFGETLRIVSAVLPNRARRVLLDAFSQRGWLSPEAKIPFDALDGSTCPRVLRGALRDAARLALFGLPGQGRPTESKHREAVFHSLSAEILREGIDLPSLSRIASRAFCHPDVLADSELGGMLRSFVAGRESMLRKQHAEQKGTTESKSQLRHAFETIEGFLTREQILLLIQKQQVLLEESVAHFEEVKALDALTQLRELRRRYPVHVDEAILKRATELIEHYRTRCQLWTHQIDSLVAKAVSSARNGDQKTAAWVIRRLHAIHALRPALLDEARLGALCDRIVHASDDFETRETRRELIEKERSVITEIREIAAAIRRFHLVARQHAADDPEFQKAETAYQNALQEVRRHDQEWLTGLFIQLEDLVGELHDETGKAHQQIEQFIESVRTALIRIRKEVRDITTEQQNKSA